MLRLALVAVLAAVALGQIPSRCSSPKQWSGRALIRDSERGQFEQIFTYYTYDETNNRKARFDEVDINRTTSYYQVIELYNEKVEYIINRKDRTCVKRELTRPFIPHSVVNNATYQGDYYIGTSAVAGAGVEIEVWTHTFRNQGQDYHWTGEFTRSQCIPVESHVDGPGSFWSESFIDIVPGIADPNVFVPPEQCSN